MRGTNGGSRYTVPLRIIPERGQRPEYGVKSPSKESCDVFQEHVAGSQFANHSGDLVEQAGTLSGQSGPASGVADVLAWEPAGNQVNPGKVCCSDMTHVLQPRYGRPVLRQHSPAVRVDLDLPSAPPAGTLQSEVDPANAGEETPERWRFSHGLPRQSRAGRTR